MFHIEKKLSCCHGYLALFIDGMDNIRRDKDNLLAFLAKRLLQKITRELMLVLVSNRLQCLSIIGYVPCRSIDYKVK
jgi:hypothetical protein